MKYITLILSLCFAVAAETPRFEIIPGYEVCSIYLNHCQADSEQEFHAALFLRKQGEIEWQSILAPVYHPLEKILRGSLLNLSENTAYQLKLEIKDGGHPETIIREFRTKSPAVPVAENIVLDETTPLPLKITRSGQPDGYLRYTVKPGTILDGGNEKEFVILLDKVSHVILDGLTVRGGKRHGVVVTDCSDIQILNCDISGFGRGGTHRPDLNGMYYDENTKPVDQDAGIRIRNTRGVLVERNYVHDPCGTANSWFYAHPAGPNALNLGTVREAAIRYNDFIGSDAHRWNDASEGEGNGSVTGSAWRDAEVTGNNFFFANDDGMELDGGQINTRFFGNKTEGSFCGVSAAPCLRGPSYYYRNLFCSTGAEFGLANVGIKNIFSGKGRGRLFFFNNTITGIGGGFSSFGGNKEAGDFLRLVSRRNLVSVTDVLISYSLFQENRVDFDEDLLYSATSLRTVTVFQKDFGQEKNGFSRKPLFTDEAHGIYTLRGLAENVGAFTADNSADVPTRPIPVSVSASRLNFHSDSWTPQTITVSTNDLDFSTPFQIRKNEAFDFLTITPTSGTVSHGKPVTLTVSIDPAHIRRALNHSAAFLIRLPNGFSRAVTVYADSTGNSTLLANDRKPAIPPVLLKPLDGNRWQIDFELKEDFRGYLFGRFSPETERYAELLRDENKSSRIELRGPTEKRPLPTWKNIGMTNRLPNPNIHLPPGKHHFILTLKTGTLLDAALAEKPETFLGAPFQ